MKPIKRLFSCMLAIILISCSLAFPNFVYAGEGFGTAGGNTRVYATPNATSYQFCLISTYTYYSLVAYTGDHLATAVNIGSSIEIDYVTIYFYREYSDSPSGRVLVATGQFWEGTGVQNWFTGFVIEAGRDYRFIVVPNTTAVVSFLPVTITGSSYTY